MGNSFSCSEGKKSRKNNNNQNIKAILPLAIKQKMLEDLNEMDKQIKDVKEITQESKLYQKEKRNF